MELLYEPNVRSFLNHDLLYTHYFKIEVRQPISRMKRVYVRIRTRNKIPQRLFGEMRCHFYMRSGFVRIR